MKIVTYQIADLIEAEYNPRQLTKHQFEQIKKSIDKFGFVDPVIINKHKDRFNVIIGGHQRVKVARDLKIKEIPCIELNLNYEQERELNVRLNKNTGEWDWDILANQFDLSSLLEYGFSYEDLSFIDIDETDSIDKQQEIKFTIVCKNADELYDLKKSLGVNKNKITFEEFSKSTE